VLRGHDFLLRSAPIDTAKVLAQENAKTPSRRVSQPVRCASATRYIPLAVHSVYSFLDSTLTMEAIVALAQRHGFPAVAVADTGNLHGAVELTLLAKAAGIKPILGATVLLEGQPTCLYVQDAAGYHNLCRLLSTTVRHADAEDDSTEPRQVRIGLDRLADANQGLIAVGTDARLSQVFGDRFYRIVSSAKDAKAAAGSRCVALLPSHYTQPQDRWKWNIVQSIRTRTLLQEAHPAKVLDGEFHLRSATEMNRMFHDYPQVLTNTFELAERCTFELQLGPPQFPAFKPEDGSTPHAFLRKLVMEGLHRRYLDRANSLHAQVSEELSIIAEVGYEEYFLVVWDILQECRRNGIEWITRGSAADSLVCYCLGISDVCPIRFDLYFRRFLNRERMAMKKLPDIDIDFAHDRKDDVVDLIFQKYGTAHTAVVGGFSTFQARSAFGEVAKVLGVAEREVRKFTDHFPWSFGGHWVPGEPAPSPGPGLMELLKSSSANRDLPLEEEPYRTAILMAEFLDGLPRYPKMHPCGVVISRQPMAELTPTFTSNKGYPTTHFDMDAVEAIGLVKMDILAQGGLAAMRDAKGWLARRGVEVDFAGLEPWKDEKVWEMIASGGSRAVHHIESPAMIGLCRQCNVRDIDGLVAIVSVIRPGAANEGKKQSFARRYQGLEPVTYPHPSLEQCLKSTFGLVVYEEHILQVCEAFAGLPPGRADVLRRALSRYCEPIIEQVRQDFFACAKARGNDDEKIAEVWGLMRGFAGYAFCKAHSTAYGVEAYQAAWLKRYHPVEFMAGVLSNGKGFYSPLVYILECHRLGIPILPPSVNSPGPQFLVEGQSIRVPLTRVKGLTERTTAQMVEEHGRGAFASMADFYRRVMPTPDEMEAMIRVGTFDGFGKTRTAQFWESRHLHHAFGHSSEPGQGWLLPPPATDRLPAIPLQEPTRRQRLEWETDLLDFAASGHPLELYDDIAWDTYCPVKRLGEHIGEQVVTCGLIIEQRTHHQVTGEPMKFLTLADWTGMVETELFAPTYRSYGLATVRYPVLEVTATVEPFENGRGFSLRVLRAGKPRTKSDSIR
jgi:DNA-directed DNA polymerase III PolC